MFQRVGVDSPSRAKWRTVKGVKLRERVLCTSTGTSALDALISGSRFVGIPCGSLIVIDEFVTRKFAQVLCRCFIAEGVDNGHSIFVGGPSRKQAEALVSDLPERFENFDDEADATNLNHPQEILSQNDKITETTAEMRIAWRYRNVPEMQSSIDGNYSEPSKNELDIPRTQQQRNNRRYDAVRKRPLLDIADLEQNQKRLTIFPCVNSSLEPPPEINGQQTATSSQKNEKDGRCPHLRPPTLVNLWQQLHSCLTAQGPKNLVRVVLTNLPLECPVWAPSVHPPPSNQTSSLGDEFSRFLAFLKVFCRHFNAVTMLVVDTRLPGYDGQEGARSALFRMADAYFQLEHLTDTATRQAMGMPSTGVDGRFYIRKLPLIAAAAPQHLPNALDLTFGLRGRNAFMVNVLHLPPALSRVGESGNGGTMASSSGKNPAERYSDGNKTALLASLSGMPPKALKKGGIAIKGPIAAKTVPLADRGSGGAGTSCQAVSDQF